jgi:hypothetical protein
VTIQTYAVVNNLPPPVTSGTGIQNWTDAMTGEVWVAKVGVSGGAWRKARDVLHGILHRSAATPMVASPGAIVPYDFVDQDAYGMFTGAANYGWNVPIPGWYRAFSTIVVGVAVANAFIQGQIQQNNSVNWSSDNWWNTLSTGNLTWRSLALMYLAAGDIVNVKASQQQGYSYIAGATYTRFEINYLGTG